MKKWESFSFSVPYLEIFPAQATQLLWPPWFAKLRTWSFLVNIQLKKEHCQRKAFSYIINDNHIYYYVRTSIFHISSLGEIYLFLYNTVDQIFLRVREEDQVTLFGAKMLGFFRLKIETVPLLFSRMQTCFEGLFLICHILYCLLIFSSWNLCSWLVKSIVKVY